MDRLLYTRQRVDSLCNNAIFYLQGKSHDNVLAVTAVLEIVVTTTVLEIVVTTTVVEIVVTTTVLEIVVTTTVVAVNMLAYKITNKTK